MLGYIKRLFKKKEKDKLYMLCERYINLFHNGDGYWITDTEIQMYEELEIRLQRIKKGEISV